VTVKSDAERFVTRLRYARVWGEDETKMAEEQLAAARAEGFREGAEATRAADLAEVAEMVREADAADDGPYPQDMDRFQAVADRLSALPLPNDKT
jgi:flagellar biosynthesis/type III secretory pathway protein FliH